MEAKKTKKADLQNRRVLFAEIGLIVALGAMVLAFNWGQSEKKIESLVEDIAPVEQEVIVNTEQDQKPPEVRPQANQVFSDFLDVVKNDQQITTDYTFDEFDEDFVIEVPQVAEEEVEEIPTFNPQEYPSFQGGDLMKFRSWVIERLRYPTIAQEANIQGKVTLRFVIERDGTLTNIEELGSPDRSLTEEARRVLLSSPKWEPGKNRGRPVRVYYILPVDFILQQ